MSAPLRIAIAGRFYWHNGSSHTLLGYTRAARRLGLDARASLLGIVDECVQQKVPTAEASWNADLLVLVCEERFLPDESRQQIETLYPRKKRVLIDPDGRYSPMTNIGIDGNHPTVESREEWVADFEELSDVILQPAVGPPAPGTQSFLYFGVDSHRERQSPDRSEKPYDLVYVGNNWYRWRDMVWLVNSLSAVRESVRRVAVFGQWWTGESVEGCEAETYSDPDFLRDNGVETHPSAPFDEVELTMGLGRLSPILIRPVLNALQLATPRMFETFAADTVPVLPAYFSHALKLYGELAAPLQLTDDPSHAITRILQDYCAYADLAREISERLAREHSYEARWAQLLDIGLS